MKNRKLSIRISEADLQTIHQRAEKANMTLTDYVTACCLGKEIVVIHGLDEVIRQQKGIGRNLNQLTTLANMGKVKVVYLQELTDAYGWNVSKQISGEELLIRFPSLIFLERAKITMKILIITFILRTGRVAYEKAC